MNKKKLVSLCLVLALAITAAIGGTMAYFTDTDDATNTFTVGKVDIILDEAPVDEYGVEKDGDRVQENEYNLVPGHTYVKDPTVTVEAGSEPSYVRMLVEVTDIEKLKAAFPDYYDKERNLFMLENLVNWDKANSKWECIGFVDNVYEFRYKEVVDARDEQKVLEALFTEVTIPGTATNDSLAKLTAELENGKFFINITAEAIQADGFGVNVVEDRAVTYAYANENANEAWDTLN